MVQLLQPAPARRIDRQRQMRAVAQDVAHEGCQVVARPAFQKHPRAVFVHPLDGLGKPHGTRPLPCRQIADRLGVGGEGFGRQA